MKLFVYAITLIVVTGQGTRAELDDYIEVNAKNRSKADSKFRLLANHKVGKICLDNAFWHDLQFVSHQEEIFPGDGDRVIGVVTEVLTRWVKVEEGCPF